MGKKLLHMALAVIAVVLPTIPSMAQIPEGYYNSLKGKKGAELKTAVYNVIKNAKVLSYGSGSGHTWWGFWQTDRDSRGYFIDRYSAESEWVKATSQGAVGSGMNIEHSFPKSWWGGAKNQAYKDLYNLMPCESKINSTKSNYPMGTVASGDKGNGWTKVGNGSDGNKYWEPADPWKGDFARGYMYMATTYQNFSWVKTGLQILQSDTYPTLKPWAYTLFIKWAKADRPDALEIQRNEDVYKIQGNRNPYVDFPNLMEYVWGDSTNIAFNPETTVKSSAYKDGGGGTVTPDPDPTPDEPTNGTIFTADFTKSKGDCTERIIKNESSYSNIWLQTSDYGWKATAYEKSNKKNNVADATLILPETDLTDYQSATLTINQAVNFAKTKGLEYLCIEAITIDDETDDEITTKLADFKVPSEDSWAFATYTLDLTQFCGDRLILAFHYTSDASVCCTWEIKNLTIEGTKVPTSIDTPTWKTDNHGVIDFSKPYETYTVDGMKTTLNKNKKGIFIIKQGNATRKMVRY